MNWYIRMNNIHHKIVIKYRKKEWKSRVRDIVNTYNWLRTFSRDRQPNQKTFE